MFKKLSFLAALLLEAFNMVSVSALYLA